MKFFNRCLLSIKFNCDITTVVLLCFKSPEKFRRATQMAINICIRAVHFSDFQIFFPGTS